ncbi:hypothetical protein C4D60_Mb08t30480 [Musa balbisiana]|uniref:Secreted protein n=1 Tax=Musa balbisiana TaxID=52838 RepID=A0A4S8K7L9_MUSBA|nr:hypothetical protein C4D60_Mb08t30480 [Musa balbisiana]
MKLPMCLKETLLLLLLKRWTQRGSSAAFRGVMYKWAHMSLTGSNYNSNSNSRGTDMRWLRLRLIGQRSLSCLTRFTVFSCKYVFICSTLEAIIR